MTLKTRVSILCFALAVVFGAAAYTQDPDSPSPGCPYPGFPTCQGQVTR